MYKNVIKDSKFSLVCQCQYRLLKFRDKFTTNILIFIDLESYYKLSIMQEMAIQHILVSFSYLEKLTTSPYSLPNSSHSIILPTFSIFIRSQNIKCRYDLLVHVFVSTFELYQPTNHGSYNIVLVCNRLWADMKITDEVRLLRLPQNHQQVFPSIPIVCNNNEIIM